MPQKSRYEAEIGPHRYEVSETKWDKTKPHQMGNWRKPARRTKFKGTTPGAPSITPISTFNMSQANAPIVHRQMTPQERKEQQVRNSIAGAVGAGGVGAAAQNWYGRMAGKRPPPEADIFGQIRRVRQDIKPYLKSDVDRLSPFKAENLPEIERLGNKHPFYRMFPIDDKRIPGTQRAIPSRYSLSSKFGDVRLGIKPKAVARQALKGKRGFAAGATIGAGLAGQRAFRNRNKPLPYHAEYSTEGMKRLKTRPLD